MGRRLDWDAARWRKRRPLISKGEEREFERQARQLARRVKKGHRNPQAHLHGNVRTLSDEEKLAYAAKMGWVVAPAKPPKKPAEPPKKPAKPSKSVSPTKQARQPAAPRETDELDDVPWWNEPEWALGKRGDK